MGKLFVLLLITLFFGAVAGATVGTTNDSNRRRHVFRSLKGIAKMVVKSIKNHKKNKPVKDPCDVIDYPSTEFYLECLRKKSWPKFPEVFQAGNGRKLQETDDECSIACRAKFPPNVFNSTHVQELRDSNNIIGLTKYIQTIRNNCVKLETVETPQELIACHIYFTPESFPVPQANDGTQPYTTGPLRTSANSLDVTNDGEFETGTFTNLFDIDAMAQMIDNGCFLFTPQIEPTQQAVTTSFTSSEEYSNSISSSKGLNVKVKAGFGPFSVHAGYNKQVKAKTETSSDKKVAYGDTVWFSPIGTIENTCLTQPDDFQLIKKYFSTFVKTYLNNAAKINDGGVIIPTTYQYGTLVKYKFTTSYEATSLKKQREASTAISAGASAAADGFTGGLTTTVNNAISSNSSQEGTVDQVFVTTSSVGLKKDVSCIQKGNCPQTVLEASNDIKKDLNKLGLPLKPIATIDITRFAEYFFLNDESDFEKKTVEQKLKDDLSYFECADSTYFYQDGFGNRADIPFFNPALPNPPLNFNNGLMHCGNCNQLICKSAVHIYPLSSFIGIGKPDTVLACPMHFQLPQNAFINDVCETSLCGGDCSTYNPFNGNIDSTKPNFGFYYFPEEGVENCGNNGLQACWHQSSPSFTCWSNNKDIVTNGNEELTTCKPGGNFNLVSSDIPSETCVGVPQCQEFENN